MVDKLKMFKNENVASSSSYSALSIPLYTTGPDERIAIKSAQLEITNLVSGDEGFYKYPTTLKINGVSQTPVINLSGTNAFSTPLLLSGSQIAGEASEVTLDIEAEASKVDYGDCQIVYVPRANSSPSVASINIGAISPAVTGGTTLLNNVLATAQTSASADTGYSGCCFTSNGIKKFAYTSGGRLYILGETGNELANYQWGHTCYGMAIDDTYCYGKTNGGDQFIKRFNHLTMVGASDLQLNTNSASYGNSNKGWIDSYDGYLYYRPDGSSTTTYKINLSTGQHSSASNMGNLSQSEYLGAVINTNVHGMTLLVQHADTHCQVTNIETGTSSNQSSAFPTNPTTTHGNYVISLAAGICWVSNGSYNQSMIIDTNGITNNSQTNSYVQTLTTSIIELGQSTDVFAGGKHQGVSPKARKMNYRVTASGVSST